MRFLGVPSLSRSLTALALSALVFTSSTRALAADDDSDAVPATVLVRSSQPEVKVGYVEGRGVAMASNGAMAMGVYWKDVCITPCKFQLPSGLQELVATGPGYVGGSQEVELHPGVNKFVVKPGSALTRIGGYTLATLGLTALVMGVIFAAIGLPSTDSKGNTTTSAPSWALPAAIGGGAATGVGIAMIALSNTSIERDASETARLPRVLGVGYRGQF
jgi:hypothetical protein